MNEPEARRDKFEQIARDLRASGIDGATFGHRVLMVLPYLPEEADGEVWRAAQAMQSMNLSNEELVELVLAIGRSGGATGEDGSHS